MNKRLFLRYFFKALFLFAAWNLASMTAHGQKIESISFHLYTDSLKKGQYNYINVDAKLSDGKWKPLTAKELDLSCTEALFDGNSLVVPEQFPYEKVTVRAILRADPRLIIEKTIWIKRGLDPPLPKKDRNHRY